MDIAALLALIALGAADGPPSAPSTRPELKAMLEGSKRQEPRLPLPAPTAEDRDRAAANARPGGLGGIVNNGRMRALYLPAELRDGGFARQDEPGMSLGYPFQTMCFWITSRINNCAYCLGHQEVKLSGAGVDEPTIAALDGDWSGFTPAQRAAFAFVRKLTYEPHRIAPADIDALRPDYTDPQILEILFVDAGFNAMNRWTGALAIPQEDHREFLTPTAGAGRDRPGRVVPLEATASGVVCVTPARRPAPETRPEVEAALAACRSRTPVLSPADESQARAALGADWPAGPLPRWARLLAHFPRAGVARANNIRAAETAGALDRALRAKIAWVAARHDRAWYALGHARKRLAALGQTDDALFALDAPASIEAAALPPAERAALGFARKLTVAPASIEDADVAALRKHFSDREVAEIVDHVGRAAFFDRFTEAARLALEGE